MDYNQILWRIKKCKFYESNGFKNAIIEFQEKLDRV